MEASGQLQSMSSPCSAPADTKTLLSSQQGRVTPSTAHNELLQKSFGKPGGASLCLQKDLEVGRMPFPYLGAFLLERRANELLCNILHFRVACSVLLSRNNKTNRVERLSGLKHTFISVVKHRINSLNGCATHGDRGWRWLTLTALTVSCFSAVLSVQLERGLKFIKCLNLGQEIFLLIASWFPHLMYAGGVESKILHSCLVFALPQKAEKETVGQNIESNKQPLLLPDILPCPYYSRRV